eukprot:CAMPEP_0195511052 /NCGR_PEP_ID=MMETSP0794_2-20130614/3506_1 /TAXON_ID=515487 /ORGANISM="Stephanopyxis turris, Strain CCMP 815" /LENGTH=368 /DNA_ID=CAMNT_0040638589 /DNA_START=161 /DNA_END=1267 /DNA_ORIENTATION=-
MDWENDIYPLAHKFMGLPTTSSSLTTPLKDAVVVVTGATSGIGLSLTQTLIKMGATVIAIGRSQTKLSKLQEETKQEPGVVVPFLANLNDLSSVAKTSDDIRKKFKRIDVLVNNAGMHYGAIAWNERTNAQNFDESFGVNYLSHFLLTEKLLPSLKKSSKLATIVQVSSSFHWAVDGSDLVPTADGKQPPKASVFGNSPLPWRTQRAYANSKLAQLLHSRALVRQPGFPNHVRVVNVCPGWVGTQIAGPKGTPGQILLNMFAFPSNGWGLSSLLHAMFDRTNDDKGDFYINAGIFGIFSKSFPRVLHRPWAMKTCVRDFIVMVSSQFVLHAQKFSANVVQVRSSPESYNIAAQDSLYRWSKEAIAKWL